jgi:hypothetical protein
VIVVPYFLGFQVGMSSKIAVYAMNLALRAPSLIEDEILQEFRELLYSLPDQLLLSSKQRLHVCLKVVKDGHGPRFNKPDGQEVGHILLKKWYLFRHRCVMTGNLDLGQLILKFFLWFIPLWQLQDRLLRIRDQLALKNS